MSFFVISPRCQACKNAFIFDPLFLFEVTSIQGPATSSLSTASSEILLLNVLRSTKTPTKSWLLFKLFGKSSFWSPESSSVSLSPSLSGGKIIFPLRWNPHRQISYPLKVHLNILNPQELHEHSSFLAVILYSYNIQTKELAYDSKVKKQTANL